MRSDVPGDLELRSARRMRSPILPGPRLHQERRSGPAEDDDVRRQHCDTGRPVVPVAVDDLGPELARRLALLDLRLERSDRSFTGDEGCNQECTHFDFRYVW